MSLNMEKFAVFFAWFHIVYTVMVLVLINQYTRYDSGMWFLLLSATYTAIVFAVREVFPGFVVKTAHLNMFKAIKPSVFALETVHVFVLGMLWVVYHDQGSSFSVFFPLMLTLKLFEAIALGLVSRTSA